MKEYRYSDFERDLALGEQGDAEALARAACALYAGNGMAKDIGRSREYFEQVMEKDKSALGYKAASLLASIYFDQSLKEKDIARRDELKSAGKELTDFIISECKDEKFVESVRNMVETYDKSFATMQLIGKVTLVVVGVLLVAFGIGAYMYFAD